MHVRISFISAVLAATVYAATPPITDAGVSKLVTRNPVDSVETAELVARALPPAGPYDDANGDEDSTGLGFGQVVNGLFGFEHQCNNLIQTFQRTQSVQEVTTRFAEFCNQFQSFSQRITSIQSFSSIRSTAYYGQYRSIFSRYSVFTWRLLTIVKQRWGSQNYQFRSLFQRFFLSYQRVFGAAIAMGLNVQNIFYNQRLDFGVFYSFGLDINALTRYSGNTLIRSQYFLGGNMGPRPTNVGGGSWDSRPTNVNNGRGY